MDVSELTDSILTKRLGLPRSHAMLVGISGIDASGKGHITAEIARSMPQDLKVAVINADGWLNLPHIRFNDIDPSRHFYEHAFRFDEMFERLVLPLKRNRSVALTADFAEETATGFRTYEYVFSETDIILLEGIFLFGRDWVKHFDLRIWIECNYETALRRALGRSQEGLTPENTAKAYNEIYFPAQRLHFALDRPRAAADLVFENG